MCYTEIGKMRNTAEYNIFGSGEADKRLCDWTKLAEDKNFKRNRLTEHKDIWPAFKKLFGGRT